MWSGEQLVLACPAAIMNRRQDVVFRLSTQAFPSGSGWCMEFKVRFGVDSSGFCLEAWSVLITTFFLRQRACPMGHLFLQADTWILVRVAILQWSRIPEWESELVSFSTAQILSPQLKCCWIISLLLYLEFLSRASEIEEGTILMRKWWNNMLETV